MLEPYTDEQGEGRMRDADMHLLLVHQPFTSPNEAGGTRHYELARLLVLNGHRVTVLASDVSYVSGERNSNGVGIFTSEHTPDGVEIRHCQTSRSLHRSVPQRLLSYCSFSVTSFVAGLLSREVDVVCGTSPPPSQLATAWALARIKRVPLVIEVRDLWPDTVIDLGYLRQPVLIACWRRLEKLIYHSADMIVANSPGFSPHLQACGVDNNRIAIVPNGVDAAEFDSTDGGQAFRQKYDLGDRCVVLFAGTHGLAAGLDSALDAANLLRDEKDIVFVFVGHGIDKGKMMTRANEMGLNSVVFVPPHAKVDMPDVLAAGDICLATLKAVPVFQTVYPNKVFDYMAASRPVVLAIDGVIRDVVEGADAGVFVQPGDAPALAAAVLGLARDRATRLRKGQNGRSYVERHCRRADRVREFEQMLIDLVGQGRGNRRPVRTRAGSAERIPSAVSRTSPTEELVPGVRE